MLRRAGPLGTTSQYCGTPAITVLGALLAFAFVCVVPAVLNDGDTYWHIAAGSWMLDHRALLRVDPFSYTFAGKPWQVHEWLSEILMAFAYRVSGWGGVVVLSAAAFAATAGLLLGYIGRFLPATAQGAVALLALSCGSGSLLARPHLLALPLLTFWIVALSKARDDRRVPPIWLTPLIAFWANLHDSYLVGLALIAVFALEAVIEAVKDRLAVIRAWAVFAAASAVMALATPFGINGVLFPLHLMSTPSLAFIGEWQPMDIFKVQPLDACIAALGYVWISRGMKIPAVRIALLAVLLYLAIAHARHGMIAGIVGAVVLAAPLGAAIGARGLSPAISTAEVMRRAVMPAAAGMLFILIAGIRLSVPVVRSDNPSTPVSALRHLPPSLQHAPVLNDYAFGGYLIFDGIKPFIDSRAELYGDSFLQDYARIIRPDPAALAGTLAAYHIGWTVFGAANPAAGELDRLGWRRIYADQWAVVHVAPSPSGFDVASPPSPTADRALNPVLTARKP